MCVCVGGWVGGWFWGSGRVLFSWRAMGADARLTKEKGYVHGIDGNFKGI